MNTKLTTTFLTGALAALFVFTPEAAFGNKNRRNNALIDPIVGAWDISATQVNCQTGSFIRSFPSLYLFNAGGTFIDTGTGSPPSQRTTGLGTWEETGRRVYSVVFKFFRFLPDGTYAGTAVIRLTIELSQDRNHFDSTSTAELLDTGGNVVGTLCVNQTGTRLE